MRWRRGLRWTLVVIGGVTILTMAVITSLWLIYPFPVDRLQRWSASPLVMDRQSRPMLRLVSRDNQEWRFPISYDEMSPWLIRATIAVEDEHFMSHPGVDPIAVVRAAGQNAMAGRIVSGASTLTMQLCRMMDDRPRTFVAKASETFRALQLEHAHDKRRIIEDYLNLAPYGGNIRGAEAAAAYYFGKHCRDLSLAEAALLAGLPQSPSRLRPDRHPNAARRRRETVLRRMRECGDISENERRRLSDEEIVLFGRESAAEVTSAQLGMEAALPRDVVASTHAAWYAMTRRPQGGRTTLDTDIQTLVQRRLTDYHSQLPPGADAAIVVIDIQAAGIRAMIGSANAEDPIDGQVNGALARRSPGSALKPFIYAAAFDAGRLSPESIVYDIPIDRDGWRPENFDRKFAGPVRVDEALRRSLNVPAILITEGVGVPRCMGLLESLGLKPSPQSGRRAGLSLAVGGIEVTLLDLTNAYAALGREGVYSPPRLFEDEPQTHQSVLQKQTCHAINDVLSSHRRRPAGIESLPPDQIPYLVWKTGTSSGRRDAWAVGHNGRFAIGVWVGRFAGGGDSTFVGKRMAEPLLATLFCLPTLRNWDAPARPPAEPPSIVVTRPLPPPSEQATALQITSPSPNARFLAKDGAAVIHPTTNRAAGLTWFLDGVYLTQATSPRIEVSPGTHELRCLTVSGDAATLRFSVAR